MTVAFHTSVYYAPPTPLGLLPGKFVVRHACRRCHEVVATDQLVEHAKTHGRLDASDEPLGSA